MADLPLQDVEDGVRYPKRRPWLVLLIVVALGAILFWRQGRKPRENPEVVTAPETAVMEVQDGLSAPVSAPSMIPRVGGAQPSSGAPRPSGTTNIAHLLELARTAEARESQDPAALAEARRLYLELLAQGASPVQRTNIEERLGRINAALALTPLPLPGLKIDYVVKSGDSIDRIAKRLGTTTRLIERSNQVTTPNRIKVGDRFRVLKGRFGLVVNKTSKDLLLTLNGEFFKRYGVGTGKFGKTPTGEFEIYDKIPEPTWWRPDGKEVPFGNPENILGTRWMAIRAVSNTPDVRGYGIHGTWDDSSIGKAESAGCIRMRNPEVEELFDLVPVGTRVIIIE